MGGIRGLEPRSRDRSQGWALGSEPGSFRIRVEGFKTGTRAGGLGTGAEVSGSQPGSGLGTRAGA